MSGNWLQRTHLNDKALFLNAAQNIHEVLIQCTTLVDVTKKVLTNK